MVSKSIRKTLSFILLNFLLVKAQTNLPIDLKGRYTCSLHPSNQMWLELRVWDENGYAIRMNAINSEGEEITACSISGSGDLVSPFYMTSKIRMTDDVEVFNSCGMTKTTVSERSVYNWRVKAYTYPYGLSPNNRDSLLTLQCDTGDLTDGRVETIIDTNVESLFVSAANPVDELGLNSFAENALITYTANLYPNGRSVPEELRDASGFCLFDCYSANNPEMNDRELFIDEHACPVPGATYAPSSSFRLVTNTGDYLKLEASFARTALIDGQNDIYVTCTVWKCIDDNDPYCEDACAAHNNNIPVTSRVDTGIIFSTNFTVQNQLAHELIPNSASDTSVVLTSANVGDVITIAAFNYPGGIDGNSDLLDAKGFYVYNCRYSTNPQMTNPIQCIDDFGCLIPNTLLTPVTDFEIDQTLTSSDVNRYVTRSGQIVLNSTGNIQLTVQCDTGKCMVDGHNYCIKRCDAIANIIDGATNLGYRGHTFTLSILDTVNVQTVQISIQAPNGQIISDTSDAVTVGENIRFGFEVTPGGTGAGSDDFTEAKGVFVHSCYATVNGRQTQFIDRNGCPVPNSPYRTSSNCRDVTTIDGVPPFLLDCGTINVPNAGEIPITCGVMFCPTARNIFCEDRCAAGAIQSNSNVVDPNVTTTFVLRAVAPDDNVRRTAIESEEIRTTIAAVSAVCATLFLFLVAVVTYCVIHAQRRRAKRKLDDRRYYY